MRLSFDWVVPDKLAAYKFAIVTGRRLYDVQRVV